MTVRSSAPGLLDEQVIGHSKDLVYTFAEPGAFALRFEAVRGSRAISMRYTLSVTAPN